MVSDEILYRCGSYDWVPLLGIWGAIGYAPLLVLRQYRSRQFIPMTQGLAQSGFSYGEKDSKKKNREIYNAWNQTCRIKRVAVNPMQDFEKKTSELERKIEQLEEEKVYLKLDVDVQKFEAENLRKGKREVDEDLDSLKTDYKQLHKSMRNAGLGKTSEQWRQETQEEKARADWWERKFHDAQAREVTCKKSLDDGQNEKQMLRAQVEELETALQQHRCRNSIIELRTSLSKIENLKGKVEELEATLQNCENQIELLEANNEQLGEKIHRSQDQVRDRDYLMGEAIAQIQEVGDHLQTLAVQADVLGVKYELESDRGRELACLLRKVKALGVRAQMQEQLAKIQQEMRDQMLKSQRNMLESQNSMISQLTQLFKGGSDKGKGPMVDTRNDNEDFACPTSFTPANMQTQPPRVSVNVQPLY
ncbi:uncharacterized protein LOC128291767 [Gossypium arboreum]|uniref:uncharacterized protein LOC128291767 n=1 Tax=Gossypium arboreum TaxID=29729 RepID=UPI0022F14F4A|nr:uncharacterized protein LOC128291767 [Gossypium arboreum]